MELLLAGEIVDTGLEEQIVGIANVLGTHLAEGVDQFVQAHAFFDGIPQSAVDHQLFENGMALILVCFGLPVAFVHQLVEFLALAFGQGGFSDHQLVNDGYDQVQQKQGNACADHRL